MSIKTYHLPNEDDFDPIEIRAVQPIPDPGIRWIACSERDASILAWAAEGCAFWGRHEEAMALKGLAMAYTLGQEA